MLIEQIFELRVLGPPGRIRTVLLELVVFMTKKYPTKTFYWIVIHC